MKAPEQTRQKIIEIAADEIHKNGFMSTSLSTILKRCEISKGALYHHFENKMELGYAVFEEVYAPMFLGTWQPVLDVEDPLESLCEFFNSICQTMSCEEVVCGCPLNNLCQEMSGIDEGFRLRILNMHQQLNHMISTSLLKINDRLRNDLDFAQVSYFIVCSFNGAISLSKSTKNKVILEQVISELCRYIRNLEK